MNYIKNLTYFFNKTQTDTQIAPSQIALYIALFQCWNKQRFSNPIYIIRDEVMRLSKITSKSTYHRSINILHQNGYITYIPSYNPYVGSQIFFNDLSNIHAKKTSPKIEQAIGQASPKKNKVMSTPINTPMNTPIEPINKHINNKQVNNKLSLSEERENCSKMEEKKNEQLPQNEIPPKEKSSAKKEKVEIPTLDEVKDFFQEKNGSLLEAEKFFNYYESTGWLVGGKSKMKKWRAAASNWIINAKASSLNVFGQQKPLDTSKDKRYDEPL